MSDTIIRVENLGKKYIIGHQQQKEKYTALRDVITNGVKGLGDRFNPTSKIKNLKSEEFWALKDVSFEIKRGDRVGIIGRNGAGKSTLLKILSRITEPTTGRIQIKGRVASLLEVGTGFHPELTGRENIYLNGAILGMGKQEIRRKFDEIVAFAEVEKFLDTPVKRYSSGMYVRLAFAVAAHLEPEILVVDEVLAVGDAAFQKKCLGKMEDVATNEGRTVLFVSHNMSAIENICNKACLLSEGQLKEYESAEKVISSYFQENLNNIYSQDKKYNHIKGNREVEIENIEINSNRNYSTSVFGFTRLNIQYKINQLVDEMEFFVLIHSMDGDTLTSFFQNDSGTIKNFLSEGLVKLSFENCLAPGKYLVSAGVFDGNRNFLDWVEFAETFSVEFAFENGRQYDSRLGKIVLRGVWEH